MKCEDCGNETDGIVCKFCGLVIEDNPIAFNNDGYPPKRYDITTLYAAEMWGWDHPMSPKIRKISKAFNPKYQKIYKEYVYVKAYETISKLCASLRLPTMVKFEALNLFRGIRKKDKDFFRRNKLAPTYLACIKIACKITDFPITNYDLANVIDYKLNKDNTNLSYMEKKFNRSYREILKLYDLRIETPEHPNFIDYACNHLKTPPIFTTQVHGLYTNYRKFFKSHFKVEGYILALIYLYGKDEYKFTLKLLEKTFHISSLTISNRKNELLKIQKVIINQNKSM